MNFINSKCTYSKFIWKLIYKIISVKKYVIFIQNKQAINKWAIVYFNKIEKIKLIKYYN